MTKPLTAVGGALGLMLTGCASRVSCCVTNQTTESIQLAVVDDPDAKCDRPRMYAEAELAPGGLFRFVMSADAGSPRWGLFVSKDTAGEPLIRRFNRREAVAVSVYDQDGELRVVDGPRCD